LVLSFTKPQFGAVKFGAPAESPFPVKLTVFGEEEALLTTDRLLLALPATAGSKPTVMIKFCAGDNVTGVPAPLKEKPVPLTVICEMVTFELPVFVTVTFWVAKVLMFTLPRLKVVGDIASVGNSADMAKLKLVLAVCAGELESVTLTVNEDVPEAVGVPLICPVEAFSVSPPGSKPLAIAQVYGVLPPLAARDAE